MERLGNENPDWGPLRRALFRFLFSYLVLYSLPFPLDAIPVYGEILKEAYKEIWRAVVPWVGELVLGVEVRVRLGGSGDTAYNYVQLFCYLILALAATAIWTLLDRRRANYTRLHEWLRVYVRFTLAAAMIVYGAYKVIPSQFGAPFPSDLLQPIGESSPMRLLWTFMGVSASYIVFTGAAEMLGGLLLVARRTTLLGALVCIAVMSNVVILNLSYDVPAKLYSSHLLLMAVFLAAPDLKRLASLFVLNRRVPPAELRPLNRAALVFRTVFILIFTVAALHRSYVDIWRVDELGVERRVNGIWEVEELTVDGTVRPLLVTDETLWRRLVFEWAWVVGIQYAHETVIREYELRLDPGPHMYTLCCDPEMKAAISFKRVEPDVLALEGTVNGRQIRGRFRRVDDSRFPLVSGERRVQSEP
ncbi:MAG TPA: hypothetical protein VNM67_17920 [Thermoanaerobaculia bacterium]|jgi:hypothetical protein|nr:hypothetical protein [Thermoanaerobaculia bacterium]